MRKVLIIGLFIIFGSLVNSAAQDQKPELLVQTGHSDSVMSIAYAPNGRFMASASADSTVKIWDTESGSELRTLRGLSGEVLSVAFSPDGRTVAAASQNYQIKFWNVETGEEIRTLITQGEKWQDRKDDDLPSLSGLEGIRSIAFSPDGKKLISGGHSNLRLWDVETGKELMIFAGHTDAILKVAFSPDGMTIASSSQDKTVRLWDVAAGKELFRLGTGIYAWGLAYNPGLRIIAAADTNGKLKLWNTTDGKEIGGTELGGYVDSIAFSRNGKTLAANREITLQSAPAPSDGVIKLDGRPREGEVKKQDILLWDLGTGKTIRTINANASLLTFSPDGDSLAGSAGRYGVDIKIWNLKNGKLAQTLGRRASSIKSLRFSADGKKLASGNLDKKIHVWNTGGAIALNSFAGHYSYINQIAFSPDGKTLASGSRDRTMKLWDTESGKMLRSFEHEYEVESVAFAPNGKDVVSNSDARTFIWNVADGQKKYELKTDAVAHSIIYNRDGNFWAAYNTGVLRLWKPGDEKPLFQSNEEQSIGSHAAVSPDGKTVALAGYKGVVKLFKAGSQIPLWTYDGDRKAAINEIAFSPDGKILAGASADSTVKIWDAASGKLLRTLIGHQQEVNSLAFTPDGKILASGGDESAIKFWDTTSGKELVSLYAVGEKDWIAITPEGLFDGTQMAWRQLIYRFNNNTFNFAPVEAFFKEFYYPGLLEEVLQGKPPHPPEKNLAQIDIRPPSVTIFAINRQNVKGVENLATDKPTVKVAVGVAENPRQPKDQKFSPTGGARDLRLFRNGSLVKIWNKSVFDLTEADGCKQIPPTKDVPVRRTICETDVQTVAGDNNFSAYVFSGDNVKSRDAELTVKGAESLKRSGTLYVLAIGANEYANPNYNLRYAVADVESIAEALKAQQNALGSYAKTEIIELKNQDATKANILAALNLFSNDKTQLPANAPADLQKIKKLLPEDALVIYYAGHGTASKDSFYLIPHDGFPVEKDLDEKARLERIYTASVSDKNLEDALESVDAGKILMVIDACNSGQALESDEKRRGPMNSRGLAQLAYEKGMYILTAAQSKQSALEVSKLGHGLLTFALLEGFQKAERDAAGNITERKWLDYATAQVPQLQAAAMQTRSAENKTLPPAQKRSELAVATGDNTNLPPEKRGLQVPRIFYRRELEIQPMIVAKP